jgi:high-affinity Fe2+/Pb2+ permease
MRDAVHTGEVVLGHILAIVAGLILMLVGIGMGVTITLIPIGVPVGVVGLGIFIWGVTRHKAARRRRDVG